MLSGRRATRLMERAMRGIVMNQGVPVRVWREVKRCWVVMRVVSRAEIAEKERRVDGVR